MDSLSLFLRNPPEERDMPTGLETLGEAARLLEELLEVRLAVQNAVHGGVVAHLFKETDQH